MNYETLFKNIYEKLLKKHGYQGWWPINNEYHPKDYSFPKNKTQKFEICIGAILTQNTSWKNVEKSLANLQKNNLLHPEKILSIKEETLKSLIKSSGYYNQKAKKLKIFSKFFIKNKNPNREELLKVWGIGEETADSILLYAYKKPFFVIDAYTKRFFSSLKIKFKTYKEYQNFFHKILPRDYKFFNEFHALIVAENKSQKSL